MPITPFLNGERFDEETSATGRYARRGSGPCQIWGTAKETPSAAPVFRNNHQPG
jgi:hypothetical protein